MTRRVRCYECNELVQEEDLSDVNGTLMCPKYASQYAECAYCGNISNDMTDTSDGLVCQECRNNEYGACDECGRVHQHDNMLWFNDSLYCEDCYNEVGGTCEDCGSEVPRDDLSDVGQLVYRWVCPNCVEECHTCNECGDVVETLRDSMCEGCFERACDLVEDLLEGYSYKPDHIFFGEGDRFFGIELETEPRDEEYEDIEMVREVQDYVSEWAYLKHDGSLCDGGFELVTHPMTLEHHLEKFTPELFKTIRGADYVSHTNGNCGLHIHISRTAFKSDLAIVKLLEFVYGNYDNIVSKLGRRKEITRYCLENEISSCPLSIDRIFESNSRERYHAINTQNSDTIELRFFRGTLIRDTFISAVQFADVLVNLANNIEDMDKKIEWSDVLLETARLGYEELSNEMAKRLDLVSLVEEEYKGYIIEEEEIKPTRLKIREDEIATHLCSRPYGIEWTREDILEYNPQVLDEFEHNYINRYELDRHPATVPTGTIVQIMPLTMMGTMMRYGRYYPIEMGRFAGGIYKIVNCGNDYRVEGDPQYSFDRSSFRVLSEQELRDRGL